MEQEHRATNDDREPTPETREGGQGEAADAAGNRQTGEAERFEAVSPGREPGRVGQIEAASPPEETAGSEGHKGRQHGVELQNALDRVELEAEGHKFGPVLLGVTLGIGVIVGGLVAFLAVFVLLVGIVR
jgi:hypothetical protein